MLTQAKSGENWQALVALRCRQEVIQRWLASQVLPSNLRQSLQAMLTEVEDQLQSLTNSLSR
jgi:hypothetical protein